jgi:hypothetical protein
LGIAAVFAQLVGEPPHITHRIAGQSEAPQPGKGRFALRAQGLHRLRQQSGGVRQSLGFRTQDAHQLIDRTFRARRTDGGRIDLAPAEPDSRHQRLGIEDSEGGGDHSPGTWPMTEPRIVK